MGTHPDEIIREIVHRDIEEMMEYLKNQKKENKNTEYHPKSEEDYEISRD